MYAQQDEGLQTEADEQQQQQREARRLQMLQLDEGMQTELEEPGLSKADALMRKGEHACMPFMDGCLTTVWSAQT